MKIPKRLLCLSLLLLIVGASLSFGPLSASAASSNQSNDSSNENITQAVTQSYNADSSVQLGMIVQLKSGDASSVVPLTNLNLSAMLGAVVSPNAAAVTLTPQSTTGQQVLVATSGRYNVLVSNQNGAIKSGDYITISSVAGVGMKADVNETIVLGKAASAFNGTSNVSSTKTITNDKGQSTRVAIGTIPVDIAIGRNPLDSKDTDYVPSFLAKSAVTVANKPVSAARIYLGLLTLLVSAIVAANIIYGGVRSGMMAIGRNPLSKKSITRSLIQTVIAGLIIFVVGIFAVYLLLKL